MELIIHLINVHIRLKKGKNNKQGQLIILASSEQSEPQTVQICDHYVIVIG